MDLGRIQGGVDLKGVRGRETTIRVYCMKKRIFNKRKKRNDFDNGILSLFACTFCFSPT